MAAKEAALFERMTGKMVKCTACSRYCRIAQDCAGFCGVRANRQGRLFLEVYGRPCGVAVDPVEKKPLFHFLPGTKIFSMGTFGCNLACDFCQNWETSQLPKIIGGEAETIARKRILLAEEIGRLEELLPDSFARSAMEAGCHSVAFTYNEPTIFSEYAYDCAVESQKRGLLTAYVSNGYESEESLNFISPYLDAINIDIKSFSDSFYQKTCHGKLEPVLDTVKRAHKKGIWVELTTLVIPGANDSEEELRAIARFIASVSKEIPWHVTAFHPDYKMASAKATSPEALVRAREIGLWEGLKYVYAGNLPEQHSKLESTRCSKCAETLVERRGHLVTKNAIDRGQCPKCREKVPGIWTPLSKKK